MAETNEINPNNLIVRIDGHVPLFCDLRKLDLVRGIVEVHSKLGVEGFELGDPRVHLELMVE